MAPSFGTAAVFFFLSLVVADAQKLESVTDDDVPRSEDVVVPNKPQSLDDCHFRYYEFGKTSDSKPTGGTTAYFGEFAHMAAIGWIKPDNYITWDCGGSLISENFVLTAAHCSQETDPDVVRLGDINLPDNSHYQPTTDIKILEFIRHPKHTFKLRYHDIALLRLERKVELNGTLAPACLWNVDEIRFKTLETAGWGATGFGENKTSTLSKVTLRPFDNSECNQLIGEGDRYLPHGLDNNQMCAGDEQQDTCEGDSGGPLQVKLLHNTRITPFVVAVTSFGKPCGMKMPAVYVRVAPYFEWIKSVLKTKGVADADWILEPQACARKYVNLREYEPRLLLSKNETNVGIDSTKAHLFKESSQQLVRLHWNSQAINSSHECYGVIIDESTVLTLARCTKVNGMVPAHVIFAGSKAIIKHAYRHPAYVAGSLRNDIGVLKVKEAFWFNDSFTPACVWTKQNFLDPEMEVTGRGLEILNAFYGQSPPELKRKFLHKEVNVLGVITEQNGTNCSLPKPYADQLSGELTQEFVCFGAEPFLVPKTCSQAVGGPLQRKVFRYGRSLMYVNALNLFGRDCGFGESAVAIRLAHHRRWLESVLYPHKKSVASDDSGQVIFLNEALEEGDNCTAQNNVPGVCVNVRYCPKVTLDFNRNREVMFCETGSLVCCPHRYIRDETNDDAMEIDACERNQDARFIEAEGNGSYINASLSHVVSIVWVYAQMEHICVGTIISKRTVLTAASCVDASKLPSHVEFLGPTEHVRVLINVEEVIIHPEYDHITKEHNLALIRTKHTTIIDGFAKSRACLWRNATHTPFKMDLLLQDNKPSKNSNRQKVKPAFLKFKIDCQRAFSRVLADSELCLKVDDLVKSTVSIQDGMPAFWTRRDGGYLVGIVSQRSSVCNCSIVLYTRISSYIDWIKSEV